MAALVLRELGTLSAELDVFARLGRHPNLTRLIAIVRSGERITCLVTELAPLGSLDGVLKQLEEDGSSASDNVLMESAMQLCDGMMHLAEMKIVHRDFALRNVLVFAFNQSDRYGVRVKVCDYGMAKVGRYVQLTTSSVSDGLPYRWMSPEAIQRHSWSVKSDVWAFGVTMWEMWTHAMIPYTYAQSDEHVGRLVCESGERLPRPDACPEPVFAVMQECWVTLARDRPDFVRLRLRLQDAFRALSSPKTECVICMEAEATAVLVPCGHRCVCAEHAPGLVGGTCPICRGQVRDFLGRVYDP